MTRHISVLGIDGSGKSSVVEALPAILAAQSQGVVGSASDRFQVVDAKEDLLLDGFCPDGLPLSARLARKAKRLAKALVDARFFYPFIKLAQMILQDRAAKVLARKYGARLFLSDGNALLCAAGRAGNYLFPASSGEEDPRRAPSGERLASVAQWLAHGGVRPTSRLRGARTLRALQRFTGMFGARALWLPDEVIFLDLDPAAAAARIARRSDKRDRHENLEDMAQARRCYLAVLRALAQRPGGPRVHIISVDGLTPDEVLAQITTRLAASAAPATHEEGLALHETSEDLEGDRFWAKVVNPRYLFSYLLPRLFEDAWREPLFALSKAGRVFLREGYSAGVMKLIYDRDPKTASLAERAFLEYPLHRAVRDRLDIVTDELTVALRSALRQRHTVRILTAPSGYAYDIFGAIERMKMTDARCTRRIELIAADLDANGEIAPELLRRAQQLGITLRFVRGDITSAKTQDEMRAFGPIDVGVFVGLSSWLDKPGILNHACFLRSVLRPLGTLVSDCFTPAPYALSGRYVGYKASYFSPSVYAALLGHAGFVRSGRGVRSGRDAINHVLSFEPRPVDARPTRHAA